MTADEARDEMLAIFKAVWEPTGYYTAWDDTPGVPPEVSDTAPWARVIVRHFGGGQTSFGDATAKRRHTNAGVLTIQVFAPAGDGNAVGYSLAQQVLNAYRGFSTGGVWYRRQHLREIGRSGAFSQINVFANFQYDDVR